METQYHKTVFYKDESFIVETEVFEGVLYLHCEVYKWNSSSLRRGYWVFSELKKEATERGFSKMRAIMINPKFTELFNAHHLKSIQIEGKDYEVMEWELP